MTLYRKHPHRQANRTANIFSLKSLRCLVFLLSLGVFLCGFYTYLFYFYTFLFLLILQTNYNHKILQNFSYFLYLQSDFVIQQQNDLEKNVNFGFTRLFIRDNNLV